MRILKVFLGAACLAAAPAFASIPPVGWQGPQWTGPGLLCRPSFTLLLAQGEKAEEQYPSVGLIRYVVRSDKGVFEVAEDWYARPYQERELVIERDRESIFKLTGRGYERTYLLLSESAKLPVLIKFDPLISVRPSFVGADAVTSVLDRVSGGLAEPQGCRDPEKPGERKSD